MVNESYDIQKELKRWFRNAKNVVVAGIGNPIRMDDFVGVKIVQALQGKVSEKVYLIECETVPESYIQNIITFNPTHVLLIDAALLGLKPGDTRLIQPEQLQMFPAISTHALPLKVFCEYITKAANAKIALLLIEPAKTDFGENLTLEVEIVANRIMAILKELLS